MKKAGKEAKTGLIIFIGLALIVLVTGCTTFFMVRCLPGIRQQVSSRGPDQQSPILYLGIKMAGAVGFEPTHADSKDPCLTAWLRPSNLS